MIVRISFRGIARLAAIGVATLLALPFSIAPAQAASGDKRWRYIRYSDGTEELYDHNKDEMEWTNLAGDPERETIKKRLAKWLPEENVPDAPEKQ